MILVQKNNYTLVNSNSNDLKVFFDEFQEKYQEVQSQHLVIDLLNVRIEKTEDLSIFYELSKTHRTQQKSFVLVFEDFDTELLPDDLIVVPTLIEAEDTLDMEAIERDLNDSE